VRRLSPSEAIRRFLEYRDFLLAAVARAEGRVSWERVISDIQEGHSAVWIFENEDRILGVASVAVHQSDIKWAEIELLAGDKFDGWIEQLLAEFETWAKANGVQQIVFYGRKGFERALRNLGFETQRIEGVKRLH